MTEGRWQKTDVNGEKNFEYQTLKDTMGQAGNIEVRSLDCRARLHLACNDEVKQEI